MSNEKSNNQPDPLAAYLNDESFTYEDAKKIVNDLSYEDFVEIGLLARETIRFVRSLTPEERKELLRNKDKPLLQ